MGSRRTRRLLLRAAATDRTFEERSLAGERVLVGKCIHCQSALVVPIDATRPTAATLEHILPQTHGGTDALENLALACARCNAGKGMRLDVRSLQDPTLRRVVDHLAERRRARLRPPILDLGPAEEDEREEAADPPPSRKARRRRRR